MVLDKQKEIGIEIRTQLKECEYDYPLTYPDDMERAVGGDGDKKGVAKEVRFCDFAIMRFCD